MWYSLRRCVCVCVCVGGGGGGGFIHDVRLWHLWVIMYWVVIKCSSTNINTVHSSGSFRLLKMRPNGRQAFDYVILSSYYQFSKQLWYTCRIKTNAIPMNVEMCVGWLMLFQNTICAFLWALNQKSVFFICASAHSQPNTQAMPSHCLRPKTNNRQSGL